MTKMEFGVAFGFDGEDGLPGGFEVVFSLDVNDGAAALGEDHVAMAIGPFLLALVGVHAGEESGGVEDVDEFLIQPPFVGGVDFGDVGVVAGAEGV